MKLVNLTVKDYLEVLKSEAPAPGGGAVSALSAAQGIALIKMVANLTIGKEKYKEHEKLSREALKKGKEIYLELVDLIDKDTEAFSQVSAAYKMAKETEEEKAERSKAIRSATLIATEIPLEVMEASLEGIRLTETLVGKSNVNAASDLGVAAQSLLAGIKGAWINVKINLPGLKNQEKEKEFRLKGKEIYEEAEVLAKKIYNEVLESL